MSSERVKTYIANLDDHLNGGVPKGHVVLISGKPGTMKSSLAYNILYHNAKNEGKNGLYISLEEGRNSLLSQMKGLGMDHALVEENIGIVDIGYLRKNLEEGTESENWLEVFKMYAENLKKTLKYEILVADSLVAIEILGGVKDNRAEMFYLFEWLRDLDVTTFIISEAPTEAQETLDEEFLADGVIFVKKERTGMDSQRLITIQKMRGTKHNEGFFTLLHDGTSFQLTRAITVE